MKYPAVHTGANGEWLSPQLPEAFTLEKLGEVKATMPSHLWAREYMCTPVSDASAMFPYDSAIRPAILADYPELSEKEKESRLYYMGCDIAMSASSGADFSVYTVVSKVHGRPLRCEEVFRVKGAPSAQQIEQIKQLHQRYHFSKILVEKTGLGFGIADALEKDDVVKGAIEGFDTKRTQKEQILSNLELLLRNHGLKLPDNDILIKELMSFGVKPAKDGRVTYEGLGAHDDTVISLALACFAAGQFGDVGIAGFDSGRIEPKKFSDLTSIQAPPPLNDQGNIVFVG
jgi:hypothetical protein